MTIVALIAAILMGDVKMDMRKTPSQERKPQGAVEEAAASEGENVIEDDVKRDLEQGIGSGEKQCADVRAWRGLNNLDLSAGPPIALGGAMHK